ncbi:tetratricopeptide repeat protein [Rickettsia endosymbiont of Gonocerus acuteangulatus]|uniref:tetratricopeptide repeat protein n=1 Tax=Rickettsia endosymbiont of Gonocerus acuteangulatus TaxID=3066266 RepID=UPI00313304B0
MLYSAKAKLLFLEGKYNEALEQSNQSIQVIISVGLSPDALFLTGNYLTKAEILSKLGRYQEALNQVEQVYNMQKRVKKETNIIFGRIFTQKAIALFGLGEKDKALEYANKALEIFKNNDKSFMSRRMPDVFNSAIAITCTIRGDILFASSKLEEALDSYPDSIEMLEYCKTYGIGLISNKAYIDKSKK